MQFDSNEPIYLQISEWMMENILERVWNEGDKIPSIREMAVEVEVNPNTVVRSYNELQDREVIHNQRGIGYFVNDGGYEKVQDIKKKDFIERELPRVFKIMDLLGMDLDDLKNYYTKYKQGEVHENE